MNERNSDTNIQLFASDAREHFLQRPDITLVGELSYDDYPDKRSSYQHVSFTNFIVAPVRPALDMADLQRFGNSVLMGSNNTRRATAFQSGGLVHFGVIRSNSLLGREVDPATQRILSEEVEALKIDIYPHAYFARLITEYRKAKFNGLIQSIWNPLEKAEQSMPIEALHRRRIKVFTDQLREKYFYPLINETSAKLRKQEEE